MMCACVFMCAYAFVCVHVHLWVCMGVCVYMCVCVGHESKKRNYEERKKSRMRQETRTGDSKRI